jgi:flavin reductase (DIM6/NTAB) family NADH-FMN oxidoreductase RutF
MPGAKISVLTSPVLLAIMKSMKKTSELSPDALREAMRAWSSGVTIVTAVHNGETHGMTVSSFTSISLDPPQVVVSIQTDSRTHRLIWKSRAFAVTILNADQQELSDRFAGLVPDGEDRLAGVDTEILLTGAPLVRGGLSWFDCRVTQTIPVGTNTLFLAEVVAAQSHGNGLPLVYYDRGYRRICE